ncbi:kinase-like protein [Lophium mytilinum]|uniref:non-specific serine/threonine protein kinase n=1 Tax=Lophium mytilinum TaxID=390894 RepID=A0A6A6QJ29_9PEZI|nr:kinase-like protein [Lophium mytilinum]
MSQPPRFSGSRRGQLPTPPSPYVVIKTLKQPGDGDGGACNAGIFLVRTIRHGKLRVEKRVTRQDMETRHMEREMKALKQLRGHFNICHIFGYLPRQRHPALYLEFYDLGALDTLIARYWRRSETLPHGFVGHTLLELSKALCFCVHGYVFGSGGMVPENWNAIIHRDIKPGNVFLASPSDPRALYPRIVLGDFGCSVSDIDIVNGTASALTSRQAPEFSPPEAPAYSRRSDVFQLGLTIHCMIQNLDVPDHDSISRTWEMGNPYSDPLDGILLQMLLPDPSSRPSTLHLPGIVDQHFQAFCARNAPRPLKSWAFRE